MTIAGLFDGVQKVNRRSIRRTVGITAVAFSAPFLIAGAVGIRINASTSLPLGLYKETTDFRAPLIEFCGRFSPPRSSHRRAHPRRMRITPLLK